MYRKKGIYCPDSETFWPYVHKTETCWLWTAALHRDGYGKTHTRRIDGSLKHIGAHRRSWKIHNGEIPQGILVLHKCDVRNCVNPNHLFLGTSKDNSADMTAKGRSANGSKNPNSILTKEKVLEMRKIRATTDLTLKQIAKQFGMSYGGTNSILYRRAWKHI